MGIPIDGTVENFEKRMNDKGFERYDRKDEIIVLKGEFTRRVVALWIIGTPLSYTTWKIAVKFKPTDSWFDLKSDYMKYVNLLNKKYGESTTHYERFIGYEEGDGNEIGYVLMNRCRYYSFWELENGVISVRITEQSFLEIIYEDNINFKRKTEEDDTLDNLDI
jgi:hypothetical protein